MLKLLYNSWIDKIDLIFDIWLHDFAVVDPDNDYIKCRMAAGSYECGGICNGLRDANLDGVSTSCRISCSTSCSTSCTPSLP